MKTNVAIFPNARIPYGTWGSSFFPAWQMSPLAEVNIGQFAGEAMNHILGLRRVRAEQLEYLIIGSTIPWHWKFWNAPMVAAILGQRVPGYHLEQACATGLQAIVTAAGEIEAESHRTIGVLTFDRTSDSPVGIFPERRSYERTVPLNDVWDNFGFDPSTGGSMIATAGRAARKYGIERQEVDAITMCRYQQYFDGRDSGLLDRVLVPLDILSLQGKSMGIVDDDAGVRKISAAALAAMRELDTCVTGGTQTHASDGMACLLVCDRDMVKELSPRPEIDIRVIAKTTLRTEPSMMPEAPAMAVGKLLDRVGLKIDDIAVIKNHNPFAVNDAVFSKMHNYDWRKMNNNGCSLVWGHPQGPTLTRLAIEAFEEAVDLGGGYVLLFGCAAGDVGIAALFEVTEGGQRS